MFEKEATYLCCSTCKGEVSCKEKCECWTFAKKGVEFGYRKANEWHYMKDVNCYEDLPQNKDVYYAYVVNVGAYDKPIIERRLGCFVEIEYDIMAYHVIAWKEIVPPKEIKEND